MPTESCRGGSAIVTNRTAVQEILDDYVFLAEVRLQPVDTDDTEQPKKARLSVTGDITFEALDPEAYEDNHHDDCITEFANRLHPYLETPLEVISYFVDESAPSRSTVYSWQIPPQDSDNPIRRVMISDTAKVYTKETTDYDG